MTPVKVGATIRGLQEAQNANTKMIAELKPGGVLGQAVRYITAGLHRYAVAITHVDTGALRASHRMEINGLHARIYIDPAGRNPRSGARTAVYGVYEHERGGEHAFYDRTVAEAGDRLVSQAAEMIGRRLMVYAS